MSNEEAVLQQVPGIPGAEASSDTSLKEAKVAFDELLRQQRDGEELNSGKAKEAARTTTKAKREKKAAKEEAPVEAAEEEVPKEEPAKEPPKKKSETERLRAKLLLSGAPSKAIEQLTDDEVREWWQGQEERERDRAQALERASEAEKKLKGTTSEPAEPKDGVPTADLDLDEIASELAEQLGEDESGTILKALRVLVSPLKERIDSLEGMLSEARQRSVDSISKTNRERLSEKVPFLAESDDAWKVIHGMVEQVFKDEPRKFSTAEAAYDHVAKILYGPVMQAASKKAALEDDNSADEKAQIAASAPTPPNTQKREKKLTPEQAAYAAFRHLDQNDAEDVEGARRIFNREARFVS